MAGAKAVMAVTPQREVPAVNKSVIFCDGKPAIRPAMGKNTNPAPTADTTTGIELQPVVRISPKLSLAATQTMPVCSTVFVAMVIPGLKVSVE